MTEPDPIKQAVKEAFKEWLDEQVTKFGYWSLRLIAGAAIGALIYASLVIQGWHK